MAGKRLFKIKMSPGRALITASNDGADTPAAAAAEEVVVGEHVAAFLLRQRAAEIIEIIEPSDRDPSVE